MDVKFGFLISSISAQNPTCIMESRCLTMSAGHCFQIRVFLIFLFHYFLSSYILRVLIGPIFVGIVVLQYPHLRKYGRKFHFLNLFFRRTLQMPKHWKISLYFFKLFCFCSSSISAMSSRHSCRCIHIYRVMSCWSRCPVRSRVWLFARLLAQNMLLSSSENITFTLIFAAPLDSGAAAQTERSLLPNSVSVSNELAVFNNFSGLSPASNDQGLLLLLNDTKM